MKRRKIKPPTNLTYGLMELASNAVGISTLDWMPSKRQAPAAWQSSRLREGHK